MGDNIVYSLNIRNKGPNTATNLIVKDLLPSGVSFVSSPDGVYDSVKNTVTWNIGGLASGSALIKTMTVKVLSTAAGKTIVNWATEDQTETPKHTSTNNSINILPKAVTNLVVTG